MPGHWYLHKATPVAHMQAHLCVSVYEIHKITLIIVNHCESVLSPIIFLFILPLPLFFFYQIPGIHHILYFLHRRHVHGPAALQKSKPLSKTAVWLQNPVMCYSLALSRMFYPSSDCHFPFISVIRLICRGLGKGQGVNDQSCHRIPISVFLISSSPCNTRTNANTSVGTAKGRV